MSNNLPNNNSLLGYTNKLTVRSGESIEFKVSAAEKVPYSAQLVRLINGDTQSESANFKEVEINSPINGDYTGRKQSIVQGSCVIIDDVEPLQSLDEFSLMLTFMPTMPLYGQQYLISRWDDSTNSGWSLYMTSAGQLAFSTTDDQQQASTVILDNVLKSKFWYKAAVRVSWVNQSIALECTPFAVNATYELGVTASSDEINLQGRLPEQTTPLLMAAAFDSYDNDGRIIPAGCFNGRLEAPVMYQGWLSDLELAGILNGARPSSLSYRLIGDWDFSRGIGGTYIHDRSPNNLNGRTYNLPSRAVKSSAWDGSSMDWTQTPAHYAAIHFHSDDLYDCGWHTDITYQLPDDLRSGIYALRLRQKNQSDKASPYIEEYVTFYVAAPKGKPQAKVAFIVPTYTYLAYGNTRVLETVRANYGWSREQFYELQLMGPGTEFYADIVGEHGDIGRSTYDRHLDGSAVHYSSWLRPLLNMRPKTVLWNLSADLLLTDWLEAKGIEYDIITDDLLEEEGVRLLNDYSVVISGNHPEYPTTKQLDALEDYAAQGGRFMYLGGNGYYWRLAVHNTLPAVVEVRRGRSGTASVTSDVGESYLEFTGELGGLCREVGRPPQRLVGVGFVCSDIGSSYYRVMPEARAGRTAFVFEGVEDEVIGDFGIMGDGAAGREFDNTSEDHGTPEHTVILARSENHNLSAQSYAIEERILDCNLSEEFCESQLCAELVFFETANGGAVFSVGSMTWIGSLSHNNYDNNVSKVTANVIKRFSDPEHFLFPA